MIPQSYTLSAYSYLLLYRLREGLCNKKARFQESRFFEYSIAHLTLIAARKRHNARDVPSAILIHFLVYQMNASAYFNRRSPWGERQAADAAARKTMPFQSTLPVGGATSSKLCADPCARISIHAPRGGSDSQRGHGIGVPVPISIHTPRRGSDTSKVEPLPMVFVFQSTLPTGGATRPAAVLLRNQPISIHAPRGGERPYIRTEWSIPGGFQSTLPAGGSDPRWGLLLSAVHISIHAPRGGSDVLFPCVTFSFLYFNPRSPRGERRA